MHYMTDRINFLAEFSDKNLESDFIRSNVTGSRVRLHRTILMGGLLYCALFLLDYLAYSDNWDVLLFSIINRLVVLAVTVAAKIVISNTREYKTMMTSLSIFEITIICSYILTLFNHNILGIYGKGMALLAVIAILFILPNRWINNLILALFGTVFFFALSFMSSRYQDFLTYLEFSMCLAVILGTSAYTSYRWNASRRVHYLKDEQLAILLETDKLTGIYHRQGFDRILTMRTHIANSTSGSFALIMIDIDNFKAINDACGPVIGDRILTACADTLTRSVRDHDFVARWSGEEYMVLSPNLSLESAQAFAERLRGIIESMEFDEDVKITASLGVEVFREGDTRDDLVERVERQTSEAKRSGGNSVSVAQIPA